MLRTGVHQQVTALLFGVAQSTVSKTFETFVRRSFTYVQRHDCIIAAFMLQNRAQYPGLARAFPVRFHN